VIPERTRPDNPPRRLHIDVSEFRKVQSLEASERRLLLEVDHRSKTTSPSSTASSVWLAG
ncbi:hypothetical protein ACCT30_45680, partial [Rhizobium ruizarguesonis]